MSVCFRAGASLSDRAKGAVCVFAAASGGALSIMVVQNWHFNVTALVGIATDDPIAPLAHAADPGFHFVSPAQHYDGTYYYAIARDPLLRGREHTLIDQATYRYGHPLHGWLAGLLSFGQARAVPVALLVLSLIGLALAGWGISRLAVHYDKSAWVGLVVAFSPGLLYASTVDTTETLGAALITMTFLAWLQQRFVAATLLLMVTCLDKEQYIAVPIGLLVWEVAQIKRFRSRPDHSAAKLGAILSGLGALAVWYMYVHARLQAWPWTYEADNFGAPFVGWHRTFAMAHSMANSDFAQSEIGTVTPPVLVATALIIVVGAFAALRLRATFDATLIGLAVITSMQGWKTLLFPHELFRTLAIAVMLAVVVLLTRPQPQCEIRATQPEEHASFDADEIRAGLSHRKIDP